jgi:mediator of RNA polymerase II transcription subunit 7
MNIRTTYSFNHEVIAATHCFPLQTEDGMPPLQVRALYAMCTDGGIDFREELLSLHRELAVNYLELLAVLVEAPSSYARQLESVGLVLRNMLHLTNLARAVQARATLCKALRHSAEKKRRAAAELRDAARRMGEALDGAARSLEEAAALPLSGE